MRWPTLGALVTAGLLAGLLLPPLAELTQYILDQFPILKELLRERQPLVQELRDLPQGQGAVWWHYLLILALLPADRA